MIQIEWNDEGEFSIVEGFEEFVEEMERSASIEVVGASDGRHYFIHEVGERVYILNQSAQNALVRLAGDLIHDAFIRPWH